MNPRPPQFRLPDTAYSELREAARAWDWGGAPRPAAMAQTRPQNPDLEESRRLELTALLDRQIAEIERQLSASRSAATETGNPHIADLEQQAGQLAALRQRVQSAGSLASLAQLRVLVTDTVNAASNTVKTAETVMAASGGATLAALRQEHQRISADNQAWLERTAGAFDARTQASTSLAAKYGIDISEEKKALDEARKREQEEKDPSKKLDWRIAGLKSQISIHDKNLANPDLTEAERKREEEAKKKAQEDLKQVEARQARQREAKQKEDHAKASENGQTTPIDVHLPEQRQTTENETDWRKEKSFIGSEPRTTERVRAVIARARAIDAQGKNAGTKQQASRASFEDPPVQAAAGETTPIESARSQIALATTPEAHEKVEAPNTPKAMSPSIATAKA